MFPSEDVMPVGGVDYTCRPTTEDAGFLQCKNTLRRFSIQHCYDSCRDSCTTTIVNNSLNAACFVDKLLFIKLNGSYRNKESLSLTSVNF